MDSHVSTWLWTKEETAVLWNGAQLMLRQLRQEMGVGVGSWRPNSAIGGFFFIFLFPTIPYSPSCSFCQTHTHTYPNPPCFPVLYPPEVRVWYQPICSNRPRNPNSLTSTTPDPRGAYPLLSNVSHSGAAATLQHWAPDQHSHRGSDRRVKWVSEWEAAEMKSCSDSGLTDMGILQNLEAINYHTAHLKPW